VKALAAVTEAWRHDSKVRVAVVVCAHRMYAPLYTCLKGCLDLVEDEADLIFVDNASPEHLAKCVEQGFPGVTTLRLARNVLFCGGYNAGLREGLNRGADFVLLLNADTEVVNPRFLIELLQTAKRWPKAAFIGPQVFFRERGVIQDTCLKYPSIVRQAVIWLPWRLFPKRLWKSVRTETKVEFLNGVCVLCRAAALSEIGLMDEQYGAYVEDADWAVRAQRLGWLSVFTPVESIIHHEEEDGYQHFAFKTFLLRRNTVLWYLKQNKLVSAWFYAAAALLLAYVRGWLCWSGEERHRFHKFRRRLARCYRGLLKGAPPGQWFGPPHGDWED